MLSLKAHIQDHGQIFEDQRQHDGHHEKSKRYQRHETHPTFHGTYRAEDRIHDPGKHDHHHREQDRTHQHRELLQDIGENDQRIQCKTAAGTALLPVPGTACLLLILIDQRLKLCEILTGTELFKVILTSNSC